MLWFTSIGNACMGRKCTNIPSILLHPPTCIGNDLEQHHHRNRRMHTCYSTACHKFIYNYIQYMLFLGNKLETDEKLCIVTNSPPKYFLNQLHKFKKNTAVCIYNYTVHVLTSLVLLASIIISTLKLFIPATRLDRCLTLRYPLIDSQCSTMCQYCNLLLEYSQWFFSKLVAQVQKLPHTWIQAISHWTRFDRLAKRKCN